MELVFLLNYMFTYESIVSKCVEDDYAWFIQFDEFIYKGNDIQ